MKPIAIKNAPHWLNHSQVVLKGRLTAGVQAEIINGMASMELVGNTPVMTNKGGNQNLLTVQHMVSQGTVSVMLPPTYEGGEPERYDVTLPAQANDLMDEDLAYICSQINVISRPLSLEEQKVFLARANGHSGGNSDPANLSPMSL